MSDARADKVGGVADSWYLIAGVDALCPSGLWARFPIGDSITAGFQTAPDTFGAWPDDLYVGSRARLAPHWPWLTRASAVTGC